MNKQEAEQAVPTLSSEFYEILEQSKAIDSDVENKEKSREALIADIGKREGWKLLREEIEQKIEKYNGLASLHIDELTPQSINFEQIGIKLFVSSLVATELQKVINRVERLVNTYE